MPTSQYSCVYAVLQAHSHFKNVFVTCVYFQGGFLLSPFVVLIIFSLCICPCSDVIKPVGVQTLVTPLLCEENTIFLIVLLHLMLRVAWFPKAMRLL